MGDYSSINQNPIILRFQGSFAHSIHHRRLQAPDGYGHQRRSERTSSFAKEAIQYREVQHIYFAPIAGQTYPEPDSRDAAPEASGRKTPKPSSSSRAPTPPKDKSEERGFTRKEAWKPNRRPRQCQSLCSHIEPHRASRTLDSVLLHPTPPSVTQISDQTYLLMVLRGRIHKHFVDLTDYILRGNTRDFCYHDFREIFQCLALLLY